MGSHPGGARLRPSGRRLVLASASPRRQELLLAAGYTFAVVPADVDESWVAGESPVAYVERVARAKAARIADGVEAGTCVLAADTTVDLDGEILAKPVDDADARRMLRALSGRTHQVHTGVVVRAGEEASVAVVTTDVGFVALDDAVLDWYLSLGEHLDKAGAYGMQGAASRFVARIDGSPSNVIGLPLAQTAELLRGCGVDPGG